MGPLKQRPKIPKAAMGLGSIFLSPLILWDISWPGVYCFIMYEYVYIDENLLKCEIKNKNKVKRNKTNHFNPDSRIWICNI